MDCNFELESNLYSCVEFDDLGEKGNKLRVAFIAFTYHGGWITKIESRIYQINISIYYIMPQKKGKKN